MIEFVEGDLARRLDDHLTRITPFGFSGAVLVADQGTVVLARGYGLANRSNGTENTADTIFSVGSITKQFTAAAIMHLQMQGTLHTGAALGEFFDEVPDDKAGITLHHLLTHTAGVINYSGEDYEMADRDETISRILAAPLSFAPGDDFAYSNSGFTLLAAIIEQVSGGSYERYLHDHLFLPAGMQHTGYRLPNWPQSKVAHWYSADGDFGTPLDKPYPSWNVMGNGEILSRVDDLYRWHVALSGSDILSEDAKREMYEPERRGYAYGWQIVDTERGRCIKHGGASSHGSSALLARWPDDDCVLVVLCNTDHHGRALAHLVETPLQTIIGSGAVETPPTVPPHPPVSPELLEGDYLLPGGETIRLSRDGTAMLLTAIEHAAASWLLALDDSESKVATEAVEQTRVVMSAALAGDTAPLVSSLDNEEERRTGVLRTWHELVDEVRPAEITVLGALPSQFLEDAWDVIVRCTGPEATGYFVCIWRGGRNVGVLRTDFGTEGLLSMDARVLGPTTMVGYRLAGGPPYRFEILLEGGTPVGLRSERGVVARRTPTYDPVREIPAT